MCVSRKEKPSSPKAHEKRALLGWDGMTSIFPAPVSKQPPRSGRRASAEAILERHIVPHPPLSGDNRSRGPRAQRLRRHSADDATSPPTPIVVDSQRPLPPLVLSPSKRTRVCTHPSQLDVVPLWEDSVGSHVPSVEKCSPTKKIKALPACPRPDDLRAALLASTRTVPNDPARAERTARHKVNRVIRLYETAAKASGLYYDVTVAFPYVLKKEFPLASSAEIRAMVEFMEARVEADALRRAREAERWAANEKHALAKLFRTLTGGAQRTMDEASFELLASLAEIPRAELRETCVRASEVAGASGAHEGGLDLGQFVALVESLPAHVVSAIRRVLPGVCATSPEVHANKALVFDDGRQQLWRVHSPKRTSAPAIMRKDTREAEWRRALGYAA